MSLAPTVIYKGEAFQTKWLQDNPLDARSVLMIGCCRGMSKLISLLGWDIRRRATHQARLASPGSKTGINKQRQRQEGKRDCFLLMATAHITHSGFWSMHATTMLLCCVIPLIRPMSIKGLMLSSSVS